MPSPASTPAAPTEYTQASRGDMRTGMAARVTIRGDARTRDKVLALAKQAGRSVGELVKEAIDRYERERLFDAYDRAYARLRADPKAWADYQAEETAWDTASRDGWRTIRGPAPRRSGVVSGDRMHVFPVSS